MSQITSRGATGPLSLTASGTFQSSNDSNLQSLVGSRWDLSDGREVMLVGVGGTAVATAGLITQDAAIVANHQNLAVTTFTAYSATNNVNASVVVTTGGTVLNVNQYQGGFAIINAGPGIGQTLKIASHGAYVASTNATIVLEDSPNTALTTSSKVCLIPPHGGNVVVFPTTVTGAVAGVTLYPLGAGTSGTPTSNYGFVCTKGIVSSLSDLAVALVGQAIIPSVSTAGSSSVTSGSAATLGYANQTAVSGEARSVFIDI